MKITTHKLALIGFGNVGQGLATIISSKREELEALGLKVQIVAVSDPIKGSIYNPNGLNAELLLETVQSGKMLDTLSAPYTGWSAIRTIEEADIDTVVELAYTDLKTGEPALTHMETALRRGRNVITTNKGPIALHYDKLMILAKENNVYLRVEGTVMSGTPTLLLGLEHLLAAGITKIEGILNGTTNYIITRMMEGKSYSEALREAQELGYAEADPTGDVEGHDAAAKVVILANLLMQQSLQLQDVTREGISKLTPEDIAKAKEDNECVKLIGRIDCSSEGFKAEVRPMRIPISHPLASIQGATNAITYTTDILGEVTFIGPGAGRMETGYAIIADLMAIHKENSRSSAGQFGEEVTL
ncbi:homoserine dehydrogenase [Peribacillus simplex]|uniref:homoserine dehydrogenase n=1 Tax=Peribacillus simplex TaxID=1478 RepID=UPI0010BF4E4C|nr:homoserine dehydrogenase [Peribacillus simplex]TKH07532.1 homoserine dehydrogenase [Peribacillus simplex]